MDKLADRAAHLSQRGLRGSVPQVRRRDRGAQQAGQITNTTQVTGAAVESLDGSDAIVIVYTNTTSTSPLTKNIPSLKYLSYRLSMKRDERPLAGDQDDDDDFAGSDAAVSERGIRTA